MRICIYGASSDDIDAIYMTKTQEFGKLMGERGHSLVFGGGAHGLMGAIARGVHESNGKILGIAPSFFHKGTILYPDCSDFIYTETMRERKQLMEENSDAFVMVPGGIGTYEEFFEILTLKQLGRHSKPIAVLNINHYYDIFIELMRHTAQEGFMTADCQKICCFFDDSEALLTYLETYSDYDTDVSKLKYLDGHK